MPQLFISNIFKSQACEKFYLKVRSLCPTFSMVAACNVKEALSRMSKIHLSNGIQNDKETGFVFPSSKRSAESSKVTITNFDLPFEKEIYNCILKSTDNALKSAIKIGLINKQAI